MCQNCQDNTSPARRPLHISLDNNMLVCEGYVKDIGSKDICPSTVGPSQVQPAGVGNAGLDSYLLLVPTG